MRRVALFLTVLTALAASCVQARDAQNLQALGQNAGRSPEQRQHLGETTGTPVDTSIPRALAYGADDEPPWVAPVLGKLTTNRPAGYAVVQHLLFRRQGTPTFLAVIWQSDSLFDRKFALYRIDGTTPPRLKIVRELDDAFYEMVEPSGQDIHGDGVAPLFLEQGSGGTSLYGYRLHALKLARSPKNISPSLRPIMVEDLDGDGTWEIVASDDRWANFFFPCGQCGPLVPVVYVWRDGAYRMACDRYRPLVRDRIALFAEPPDFDGWPPRDQARLDMERALLYLQAGDAAAAQGLYRRTVERLRLDESEDAKTLLRQVEAGFGPLMKASTALAVRTCPVQAGEGGGHYADPID